MTYPKTKFELSLKIVEATEGKHNVIYEIVDNDSTMKDIGLALYKLKQIEQELIDRIWDEGGEGYEITQD